MNRHFFVKTCAGPSQAPNLWQGAVIGIQTLTLGKHFFFFIIRILNPPFSQQVTGLSLLQLNQTRFPRINKELPDCLFEFYWEWFAFDRSMSRTGEIHEYIILRLCRQEVLSSLCIICYSLARYLCEAFVLLYLHLSNTTPRANWGQYL